MADKPRKPRVWYRKPGEQMLHLNFRVPEPMRQAVLQLMESRGLKSQSQFIVPAMLKGEPELKRLMAQIRKEARKRGGSTNQS